MKNKILIAVTIVLSFLGCSTETTSTYLIELNAIPGEAGTVSGQGEYNDGEQVEITATANDKWIFTEWQGDYTGTQSTSTVTVNSDMDITAIFEELEHSLDVAIQGNGSVSEEVVAAKTDYEHGTIVELTATPNDNWNFVRWEGDATGEDNPVQVEMSEDRSITVVFEIDTYSLAIQTTGNGSVEASPDQSTYSHGSNVTLTAIPDDGWSFSEWSGDVAGSDNPASVNIEEDISVTAVFEECTDPDVCVITSFTASTIVGDYIFETIPELKNNLSSSIFLKSYTVKRGGGSIAAQESAINTTLDPGDSVSYSVDYLPQPTAEEFNDFTIEWVFDYNETEITIIDNAVISSSN